jgi:hypothetical protein
VATSDIIDPHSTDKFALSRKNLKKKIGESVRGLADSRKIAEKPPRVVV